MSLTFLGLWFRDQRIKVACKTSTSLDQSIDFYSKLQIDFSKKWKHRLILQHGFQQKCSILKDSIIKLMYNAEYPLMPISVNKISII